MIKRIELTNFMSHRHTVIEPAPGLTVLVGPNNCGKSAVVTALKILCTNDRAGFVTRHGEKECSVRVETEDGHTIEWLRKTSPRYVINGNTFDRLGQGNIPDELHRVLRLPAVEGASDDTFDIHFGEQKSPLFLIDRPGSHAATFFASSSDVIRLLQMQRLHREKISKAKSRKGDLEEESRRVNHQLEILQPLDDLDEQLAAVERLFAELDQLTARIERATRDEARLRSQLGVVGQHSREASVLGALQPPPPLEPEEALVHLIGKALSARRAVNGAAREDAALAALAVPPALADAESLDAMVRGLELARATAAAASEVCQHLQSLEPPPAFEDASGLTALVTRMTAAGRIVQRLGQEQSQLDGLPEPPPLVVTDSLARLVHRFEGCQRSVESVRLRHSRLESLAAPPTLREEAPLLRLVESVDAATVAVAQCEQALDWLAALGPAPSLVETAPLAALLERLEQAHAAALRSERELLETMADVSLVRGELGRWSAAHPVCPTCGHPVDLDSLLTGAGTDAGACAHA